MPTLPFSPAQPAPQVAPVTNQPQTAPAQQRGTDIDLVDLETIKQSLGAEAAEVFEIVGRVWDIVLIKGSDGKPLMTVGTLCGGLVLLGLGYIAAGMISRWIASKLLTRFGLNQERVAPLQSITFYVLLATFTMLSLNVLNVPMTVFSFLGGALAIGAGFGSQNIVNNFISGLILLAERPIRVGDVIQLDSLDRHRHADRRPQHENRQRLATTRSSFPTASCWKRASSTGRSPTTRSAAPSRSARPTARRRARSSGCCCWRPASIRKC